MPSEKTAEEWAEEIRELLVSTNAPSPEVTRKCLSAIADAITALTAERDAAIKDRDHWKANHDQQVKNKRAMFARLKVAGWNGQQEVLTKTILDLDEKRKAAKVLAFRAGFERDALAAKLERAVEMLHRISDYDDYCPCCGRSRVCIPKANRKCQPDCELAAILTEQPKETREET